MPRVGAVEERDALDDVGVQESERRQGRCAVKGRVEGEAEETGDQAAEWGGFRWTSQIVSGLSLFEDSSGGRGQTQSRRLCR